MFKKLLIVAGVVGAAVLVARKIKQSSDERASGTRPPPPPTCDSPLRALAQLAEHRLCKAGLGVQVPWAPRVAGCPLSAECADRGHLVILLRGPSPRTPPRSDGAPRGPLAFRWTFASAACVPVGPSRLSLTFQWVSASVAYVSVGLRVCRLAFRWGLCVRCSRWWGLRFAARVSVRALHWRLL